MNVLRTTRTINVIGSIVLALVVLWGAYIVGYDHRSRDTLRGISKADCSCEFQAK